MLPVIQVGPLAIQFPGLILLVGLWIGLELVERQAALFGVSGGKLYNLALIAIGAGIVGARLVYVAQNPSLFEGSPFNLLSLSPKLLSIPGGLITAFVAGLAYAQRSHLSLWPTLDALSILFATMLFTVALANFASGNGYGAPANLPWGVELWGSLRHPSQLYEALAALAGLVLIWPKAFFNLFSRFPKTPGTRIWMLAAFSAASRLFLETFRGDSSLVLGQYRIAQLIAWPILALSLWNLNRRFTTIAPVAVETENP